jgi:hypothetical protein
MARRLAALLFLVPALGAGGYLARDLAQPARAVRYHGRPPTPPAASAADSTPRATDWAGPLARLRGWSAAAGVERPEALLALFTLGLVAAGGVSLFGLMRGRPEGGGGEGPRML